MRIVLILLVLVTSASATDYLGRLAADDFQKGGDSHLAGLDSGVATDTDPSGDDPAPVGTLAGEASESPSSLPDETAPLPFDPTNVVHTLEVGLHKGSATYIGGGAFISCNHLRRDNPGKAVKVDGVQYGGTLYGLDDIDLCLLFLNNIPEQPSAKAVRRPLKEGEVLTLVGKMTGRIQGIVRYDRKFNDGSVWLETPGTGVIPGDSGGGAFDGSGNLVAVIVGDAVDSDHVFVVPLNLEKNRFPKHQSILQGAMPMPTQEPLIKGRGMEALLFSANWCMPCHAVKKALIPQIESAGHKVTIIDIDQHRDLSVEYDILSVPTWVILKDGVEIHRESYGKVNTLLKVLNGP